MVKTLSKYKLNQLQKPLFDMLMSYGLDNSNISFDVPGHKRGKGINKEFIKYVGEEIFKIDVNSLKPLDMLSHPTGVIKQAEDLYADIYNIDHAYFLVNGSTSGVQNMILSTVNPGEKIILPRNSHKSAINGLVLSGAIPIYITPTINQTTGISENLSFEKIKKTIDANLDAKSILILNPTYFGAVPDLKQIIEYAHSKDMFVIVDESHGAHFPYCDKFPDSAMKYGADLATISMHKTGGSLTQSSVLLHNSKRLSHSKVRSVVNLAQTSSASYLLLSSLDIARYNIIQNKDLIFNNIINLSNYLREEINKIDNLNCLGTEDINNKSVFNYDLSKIVIDTTKLSLTGFELYDLLHDQYQIQTELGETNVILVIISIGDTLENVQKLITALKDIASKHKANGKNIITVPLYKTDLIYSPREAFFMDKETINIEDSVNKIAGKSIMIYPPGIPLVNPGEKITQEIIDYYKFLNSQGNVTLGSNEHNEIIEIDILKVSE